MSSIQSLLVPQALRIEASDTGCKKVGKYSLMPIAAIPYAIYKIASAALSCLAKIFCCSKKNPSTPPFNPNDPKVVVVPPLGSNDSSKPLASPEYEEAVRTVAKSLTNSVVAGAVAALASRAPVATRPNPTGALPQPPATPTPSGSSKDDDSTPRSEDAEELLGPGAFTSMAPEQQQFTTVAKSAPKHGDLRQRSRSAGASSTALAGAGRGSRPMEGPPSAFRVTLR